MKNGMAESNHICSTGRRSQNSVLNFCLKKTHFRIMSYFMLHLNHRFPSESYLLKSIILGTIKIMNKFAKVGNTVNVSQKPPESLPEQATTDK